MRTPFSKGESHFFKVELTFTLKKEVRNVLFSQKGVKADDVEGTFYSSFMNGESPSKEFIHTSIRIIQPSKKD